MVNTTSHALQRTLYIKLEYSTHVPNVRVDRHISTIVHVPMRFKER